MKLLTLGWLAGYASTTVLSTISSKSLEAALAESTASLSENKWTSVHHANHIFNAVRGAMRQWDSSWNHNGMSFFLAEVPKDIQLYHGTGQEERVTGMEWLAFEPEHALMFARGRGPRGGPPRGRKDKLPELANKLVQETGGNHDNHVCRGPPLPDALGDQRDHHGFRRRPLPPPNFPGRRHDGDHAPPLPPPRPELGHHEEQHILVDPPLPPPDTDFNATGYLHFYRTLNTLSLLYIDGMSAGKTSKGTLDSQDYILRLGLNNTPVFPFGDYERAQALCNVSRDSWDNRIDGFLRMEAGFEIILCNFSSHLQLEHAQVVKNDNSSGHGSSTSFHFYRAIADRFHGIGGGRVNIDFANMVTAFSSDADLFINDTTLPDEMLPRLENQSMSQLLDLQEAVTHMVINPAPKLTFSWQSIADMFVQRYAASLQYLVLPHLSNEDFKFELNGLLRPFISDSTTDIELATQRCIEQFLPDSWQDTLAGQAVQRVGHKLCDTLHTSLFDILSPTASDLAYTSARTNINQLVAYLDWPIWRECSPGCAVNELCILPIWPMTSNVEYRKQPKCKNATWFASEEARPRNRDDNYWLGPGDRFPGGPPLF